ncbi:MAG: hypothetical protein HY235_25320 [Acidobacteria bacterium]|nr:hypothetical protein [Acidobacteriota bacterium]
MSTALAAKQPVAFQGDALQLDQAIAACANEPAVFLIWPPEGAPYLGRTILLRRRLERLLGERSRPSRLLHLRSIARRVEYWRFASRLEASLLMYQLAREHFPDYPRVLRLRQPAFVKLILSNPFPRTQVTVRLSGAESIHYGPFRTRVDAEAFEAGFLDFFQIRRCQEDLDPSPQHPGCVYGEMNKCLRPCQQVVTAEEYASEAARVASFLRSGGESLLESMRAARERLSEEMEFEEASRLHKRMEKAASILQARGDLAADAQTLSGIAVTPSTEPESVELWFFLEGSWRPGITFSLRVEAGKPVSMDRRLKETVESLPPGGKLTLREREEHLSLLAGWFYSSWREGEWVGVRKPASLPYRRLVNAIHRVAKSPAAPPNP